MSSPRGYVADVECPWTPFRKVKPTFTLLNRFFCLHFTSGRMGRSALLGGSGKEPACLFSAISRFKDPRGRPRPQVAEPARGHWLLLQAALAEAPSGDALRKDEHCYSRDNKVQRYSERKSL